jgi:hypothetical protein
MASMQVAPLSFLKRFHVEGVTIGGCSANECRAFFASHGIEEEIQIRPLSGSLQCRMSDAWMAVFAPDCNTLSFHAIATHISQEILWALLVSPVGFEFKSLEALASSVQVRKNIALAARKTALAFKTEAAERPADYWHYEEEAGFILQPGRCLIDALVSATQPEATGKLYDFSCYRATEYVILLGLAQEASTHNPTLLNDLQKLNEVHAVRSGQFHDVYLHEYGTLEKPLPSHFFVPGDRLWFRNPDEASSDVTGYEGSWVIYMGSGLFSNFWKRDQPYTLITKCVEIYHWRDGLQTNAEGELWIDESVVEARMADTLRNPTKLKRVLERMMKMRDPKGVYADGGCLDSTREYPKQIFPGSNELRLPSY